MKKMNLNILMGFLLALLVASCRDTASKLHFGESAEEEKQENEQKEVRESIEKRRKALRDCSKKVWEQLGRLANEKEVISKNISFVRFMKNEDLWGLIEPYLGKDHITLLVTLTMLGNHNDACETLQEIVEGLKHQDQAKAKWLIGKLIAQLHEAALHISTNDQEQFALITNEKAKEGLRQGLNHICTLASNAGVDLQSESEEAKNLRELGEILGFKKRV